MEPINRIALSVMIMAYGSNTGNWNEDTATYSLYKLHLFMFDQSMRVYTGTLPEQCAPEHSTTSVGMFNITDVYG